MFTKQLSKKKLTNTFWRFLLSYIVVFFIPTMLMLFYFYPRITTITKDKAYDSLNTELSQYKENIEVQLTTIIQYSDIFFRNSHINLNMLKNNNEFNRFLLKQELRNMAGGNIFVEELFFYNKYTKYLTSSDSNFSREDFISDNNSFYFMNWDKEEMYDELENLDSVRIHPNETIYFDIDRSYQGIVVLVPVPYPNSNPYGVLLIIVTKDRLFSHFGNLADNGNNLIIFSDNGDVISSLHERDYLENENFIEKVNNIKSESDIITIAGEDYIIYKKKSDIAGLNMLSITPLDDVLGDVRSTISSILTVIITLFLIGIIIIFMFMYLNYLPIRRIKEKLTNEKARELKKDDMLFIDEAINALKKENNDLTEEVIINKNIAKEYFLIRLVNGNFENDEIIRSRAGEYNINLKDQSCCITFGSPNKNIVEVLEAINKVLSVKKNEELYYLIKGLQHEDFIVLFFFDDESEIKPYIYELYKLDKDICIGIGSNEKISQTNRSYTFSLAALEYGYHHRDFPVTSYYDMQYEDYNDIKGVVNQLNSVEISILHKDTEKMLDSVLKVIEFIRNKEIRNILKKTIYISANNILSKGLQEAGYKAEFIYVLPQNELDIMLAEENLLDKQKILLEYFDYKKTQKHTVIEEVIEYIIANFTDANLSLSAISDKFMMSGSSFSHYFKRNKGITFVKYLEDLRIEESKKLILYSSFSMDQISQKVGYNSANSFTRSFKKVVDMTPSEYKKTNKGSD